ncbi:MAG: tetratricopeptide repeat protein [Methanobacteriota archaeon]
MMGIGKTGIQVTSKFVGRAEEVKYLRGKLQQTRGGKGALVLVSGEAGVGKTRLVDEVGRQAVESGFLYLTGRCISQKDAAPYLPFLDALKNHVNMGNGGMQPEEARMPVGLAAGMAGSGGTYEGGLISMGFMPMAEESSAQFKMDAQSEREKMFNTLTQQIIGMSRQRPVLLFIDDLQWADNASLQLLHYVARSVGDASVLICGAYRPAELASQTLPLEDMLRRMNQEKLYEEVNLERFKLLEIGTMVKDILGIDDVPEKFIGKLYDMSEGNPFFVEEVLKALVEEGIVKKDSYVWDTGVDLSSIRIPGTIKDVISRRVARMDENTKKVLMYAAVIGNRFNFEVLHRVTGMDVNELLDAVDKLMAVDIIREDRGSEDETYIFDHKQTASVIYDEMSKSRVRLMHKQVGEITEDVYASRLDEVVYPLARHFALGRENQKAYKYNLLAGDKARRLLAYYEAIEYYNQAIRLLAGMTSAQGIEVKRETARLQGEIGLLLFDLGDWGAALPSYEQALHNARLLGDKSLLATTLRGLADVQRQRGKYNEAEQHYEESLLISEDLNDASSVSDIQRGLGYVHWRKGEIDEAIDHYNQSISYAMKKGDQHSTAKTYIEMGNVYNQRGDHERAVEYYTKAIGELEKVKDYPELARAYNNLGDTYLNLKEWDKAIEYLEKSKTVSEKIGNTNYVAWGLFNAAYAYAHKGETDRAIDYSQRSLKLCEKNDDKIGMCGAYKSLGVAYRIKKEWQNSISNLNKGITIYEMLDIPYDLASSQIELGRSYAAMGEKEAAKECFNSALERFKLIGSKFEIEDVEREMKALDG